MVADALFPEILQRKDAVTLLAGQLQGHTVIQIAGDYLHPLTGQRFGGRFVGITGQGAHAKALFKQQGNQGAALGTGGTGNKNALVSHG